MTSGRQETTDEVRPTPGPWRYDAPQRPSFCGREPGFGFHVYTNWPLGFLTTGDQSEYAQRDADCKLVAAAPELLETLEWLRDNKLAWILEPQATLEVVERAIAKAKGGGRLT